MTTEKTTVLEEMKHLVRSIKEIYDSGIPWKTKYSIIFRLWREAPIGMTLGNYCDPDSGYEEDVTAFVEVLMEDYGCLLEEEQ